MLNLIIWHHSRNQKSILKACVNNSDCWVKCFSSHLNSQSLTSQIIIHHTNLSDWLKEIVLSINKCCQSVSLNCYRTSVMLLFGRITDLCKVMKAHWDRCKQPIGVWCIKKSVALYPGCVQALLPSNWPCRLETARPAHVTWPFLLFKTTLLSVRGLFRLLAAAVWIGTRPTIHPTFTTQPFCSVGREKW